MRSTHSAAAAAFAVVFLLAGCGTAPVALSSSSPTAQVSASPTGSPSASSVQCQTYEPLPGLCVGVVGQVPTHQEYVAMTAAGAPPIEKALGYKDWSLCSNGENCYRVAPEPSGMVGTDAGVLNGGFGQYPGGGLGAACWVFLYRDSGGWHFLNFACAQNPGFTPGSADTGTHVFVSGCANYRTSPSLTAKVLGCLANGAVVNVDSAPVYAEAHIWWHLTGRGWMAHDYLCEICRV
jgi:hypothetical protein